MITDANFISLGPFAGKRGRHGVDATTATTKKQPVFFILLGIKFTCRVCSAGPRHSQCCRDRRRDKPSRYRCKWFLSFVSAFPLPTTTAILTENPKARKLGVTMHPDLCCSDLHPTALQVELFIMWLTVSRMKVKICWPYCKDSGVWFMYLCFNKN